MNDPFVLMPQLWFGLLCEGLASDQRGRLNFQAVFNQIAYLDPPEGTGVPPNAFLNGFLAVGFTEGLGQFRATVQLCDVDGHVLWDRPEGAWEFSLGPGESASAVLVQQVQYWLREPGRYHFRIRMTPNDAEYQIPFEAARQIGPAVSAQDAPGDV